MFIIIERVYPFNVNPVCSGTIAYTSPRVVTLTSYRSGIRSVRMLSATTCTCTNNDCFVDSTFTVSSGMPSNFGLSMLMLRLTHPSLAYTTQSPASLHV